MFTETSSHVNEASYRICYSLAQRQVPFSHAEMFKKAFVSSADFLFASFPNKDKIVQQIGKLPLSSDTCTRRCDDLSGDIENDKFRVRLCVLTDIFGHLNKLNLLLQGRAKLLCNLYEAVKGFEGKIALYKRHAEDGNCLHFKFTREFCGEDAEHTADDKVVFVDVLDRLETAFNGRFADFAAIDDICCFFASPFTAEPAICSKLSQTYAVDEAALQDNFIDFKVVPGLRNEFSAAEDDITMFWTTQVPLRFPVLNEVAQKFLVLFGSTRSCESGFSAMKSHKEQTLVPTH